MIHFIMFFTFIFINKTQTTGRGIKTYQIMFIKQLFRYTSEVLGYKTLKYKNKIRPTFTSKTDLLIDKLFSNQISNQKTISWEG